MSNVIQRWVHKYFSDPEAVILAVLLVVGFTTVIFLGGILAPLLTSIVVAYLLEGLVGMAERHGMPRLPAVFVVFALFMALLLIVLFGLIPMLSAQITQLVQVKLPDMIDRGQQLLLQLPMRYPNYISETQITELMAEIRNGLRGMGQQAVSLSIASISGLFMVLVYLFIVPVLVFFLLKDKSTILTWFMGFMPQERRVATRVWTEMNSQIANYVRGKFLEVVVVGIVTYVGFAMFNLQYASLLGALVGLSVIIPYVGVAVVTIPVAAIAFFQFGATSEFAYLMVVYGVIQVLDGNVLVPLLFSEAVNLHPVAIIAAVVVFGGIWGLWGVFFAIPLATLVSAVLHSWPRASVAHEPAQV